jgi:hypothetical protein
VFNGRMHLVAWWHQSVEHYSGINVEGRRFSADCIVAPGSKLTLSNSLRVRELSVQLLIFETNRMQHELAQLPQGALGSFSFYDATPAYDDIPTIGEFVSGWFVLNAQSLDDAWNQVLRAGYSECTIEVRISPVQPAPPESWVWNVTTNPHLVIDTVSIAFKRPSAQAQPREEEKRRGFWRPG